MVMRAQSEDRIDWIADNYTWNVQLCYAPGQTKIATKTDCVAGV